MLGSWNKLLRLYQSCWYPNKAVGDSSHDTLIPCLATNPLRWWQNCFQHVPIGTYQAATPCCNAAWSSALSLQLLRRSTVTSQATVTAAWSTASRSVRGVRRMELSQLQSMLRLVLHVRWSLFVGINEMCSWVMWLFEIRLPLWSQFVLLLLVIDKTSMVICYLITVYPAACLNVNTHVHAMQCHRLRRIT